MTKDSVQRVAAAIFSRLKGAFAPLAHTHPDATASGAGFMNPDDKKKLDKVPNSIDNIGGKTWEFPDTGLGDARFGADMIAEYGNIRVGDTIVDGFGAWAFVYQRWEGTDGHTYMRILCCDGHLTTTDETGWWSGENKYPGFASSSHRHSASDIISGTLAIARIPTGTTSSTVALGNHSHSEYAEASKGIVSLHLVSLPQMI